MMATGSDRRIGMHKLHNAPIKKDFSTMIFPGLLFQVC